jgi:hypothetical protein
MAVATTIAVAFMETSFDSPGHHALGAEQGDLSHLQWSV